MEIWPEPGNLIDKAPITYCIDHTPEYLVDISSIGLDIKLQIKNVKAGEGAAARGAMPVFFTNNLISSLFSTAKVEFNNHVVEANYNLPMTSRLDHILTTSDEVTEECGQVQGTFPIKSDSPANTISAGFIGKNTTKERIKYTRGNIVHIRGPLPLDITSCVDWLVDGVNIKVQLEPNNARFLLNKDSADETCDPDYDIKSIKLLVTKYRPAPAVNNTLSRQLLQNPIEYLSKRNMVYTDIIPANRIEHSVMRPFQSVIPNKLYIFFVEQESVAGLYHKDPFYFESDIIDTIQASIDGVDIFTSDCSQSNVEVFSKSVEAHCGEYFIPFPQYNGGGSFVICIDTDFTSDQNSVRVEKHGSLALAYRFKERTVKPLKMFIVGNVDSTFTVDHNREVLSS